MKKNKTYNVNSTGICTRHQHNKTNNHGKTAQDQVDKVFPLKHAALFEEHEPEDGGEVVGEAGDEERGRDGEKVGEEGNGLGNDPSDNGKDGEHAGPDNVRPRSVDVSDDGVLEGAGEDEASDDGAVDGSRDEDDGQANTESNLGDQRTSREQSRGLDIRSNKGIDDCTGDGVNSNLDESKSPDGLLVVLGGVHLVHEGELADGKAVGKDNVGNGNEGIDKGQILLGPGRPGHCRQSTIVGSLDTGSNHGDTDGNDD